MLNKKTFCKALLCLGLGGLSVTAFATDLHITNNTDQDSTCMISNRCSSRLPHGVTRAHSENWVPSLTMRAACMGHATNCIAHVYMNNNCSGAPVALAVFDVKKVGLKSLTILAPGYRLDGSGFDLTISPA